MVVTCVTCRYLPNLRHIARLHEVDCAIVLDLAPLPHQNKNSFISRNRLTDKSGRFIWLSIPIQRKGIKFIRDARVDETCHNWIEKHLKSIAQAYPNHRNIAGDFLEKLKNALETSDGSLIDINLRSLYLILECLKLENTNLIRQSSILETHTKSHRLDAAKLLNATSYIAGHVEWELMQQFGYNEKMNSSGIRVIRSPELNPSIFPLNITTELSCIHTICTIGPEKTRVLIDQMIQSLRR